MKRPPLPKTMSDNSDLFFSAADAPKKNYTWLIVLIILLIAGFAYYKHRQKQKENGR